MFVVLASQANFSSKLKGRLLHSPTVLFRMFDFENKGFLSMEQGILMYKSVVIGYLRATGAPIPSSERIMGAAQVVGFTV